MRNFRIRGITPALCLLFVAGAAAARAGTITLTLGGSGGITGTITFTETGNDTLITAISGTLDGSTIGSLLPTGDFGNNDNLFFTPAPYLDNNGVSFSLSTPVDGLSYANLYWTPEGPGFYEVGLSALANSPSDNAQFFYPETLTVSGVPEPGTICLTLAGLAGLVALRRQRR